MRKEGKLELLNKLRIIISGGGTGGHLYPALAIAEALKKMEPSVEILFVGANGKIEMEKVPEAGYAIIGLDIRGFQRSFSWENLKFPFRLLKSYWKSISILKNFKPQIAIGVGGYASGPLLMAAGNMGIPSLIQEQNSYPGKTNLYLSRKASLVCVAYPRMERYFEEKKIKLTGNPVRENLQHLSWTRDSACQKFQLKAELPILLILGGSGGAKTLNDSVLENLGLIQDKSIQLIWQTGKNYYEAVKSRVMEFNEGKLNPNWIIQAFLDPISQAYACADLVISRAGAGTISELSMVGLPLILVPSPNVAEDHQTKNALSLVENGAAIWVKDGLARTELIPQALALLENPLLRKSLSEKIKGFAFPNAGQDIAQSILTLIQAKSDENR